MQKVSPVPARNHTTTFLRMRNDKAIRAARFGPVDGAMQPRYSDSWKALLAEGQPRSDAFVLNIPPVTKENRPDWVRLYEETKEHINSLNEQSTFGEFIKVVNDLKKMQLQRLKPKFTTEDAALDRAITELMRDIYKTLSICESNVKMVIQSDTMIQPVEKRILLNVQQTLAQKVQEVTKAIRKQEKEYYTKRKELEGDDPSMSKPAASQDDLINDAERMELESMEQMAVSRDVEINNLVQNINDLAVLFKELSVLVVDQGNILDRIDYNIEQAVRHTKKANVQLHKSEEYQKTRIKSCIGCLVISIIIMVVMLIIKHT